MLSVERPNPPPPERLGGAYELPPPPVVSANSAKDNLTPFDFFFVSFTLAAAPSDGKDESPASAGVGSSPSDGNADAGGPRESNPSSFSSVYARERKTHKERKKRVSRLVSHPSTVHDDDIRIHSASFNSEPTQRKKPEKIMHPIPNPPRVAHLASRVSHPREPTRKKFPSTRFPSVPRHPRVARRHTARTLNSDRRRDVSRGMNPIHSVHVLTDGGRASAHHSGWMVSKNIYAHACVRVASSMVRTCALQALAALPQAIFCSV